VPAKPLRAERTGPPFVGAGFNFVGYNAASPTPRDGTTNNWWLEPLGGNAYPPDLFVSMQQTQRDRGIGFP
jgi:hypothetical protein